VWTFPRGIEIGESEKIYILLKGELKGLIFFSKCHWHFHLCGFHNLSPRFSSKFIRTCRSGPNAFPTRCNLESPIFEISRPGTNGSSARTIAVRRTLFPCRHQNRAADFWSESLILSNIGAPLRTNARLFSTYPLRRISSFTQLCFTATAGR
jgi:hypothetical protein